MPACRVGALQCLGCLVTKARPGLRNAGHWKGEGRSVSASRTYLRVMPKPVGTEGRRFGWLVGPFQGPGVPNAQVPHSSLASTTEQPPSCSAWPYTPDQPGPARGLQLAPPPTPSPELQTAPPRVPGPWLSSRSASSSQHGCCFHYTGCPPQTWVRGATRRAGIPRRGPEEDPEDGP